MKKLIAIMFAAALVACSSTPSDNSSAVPYFPDMPTVDVTPDQPAPIAVVSPSPTPSPHAHKIKGLTVFAPGSYPFNKDISLESAITIFTCENHCPNMKITYDELYPLHIDDNTPNELEHVGSQSSHTIPDMPFAPYTTLAQIVGGAGDHPFEAVDPTNKLVYDVYNVQGTPPANTNAFSGCVDPIGWDQVENTVYGPCNSSSGWHDAPIAGGLAPEEVTGVWAQPYGTVNHGLILEEPGCGGRYCGTAPQCIRLNTSRVSEPSDPEAKAVYYALTHYCTWTLEGGAELSFSRLNPPQPGDADFDAAVYSLLTNRTSEDFDVVQCQFENDGSTPNCP